MNDSSTPYAGTEGFSGTDTSRDRAESKAASAKRRQNAMLRYLASLGSAGATVVEAKRVAAFHGEPGDNSRVALPAEFKHHGTTSGTLSILHRAGAIARLVETRGKAHVYVLPEHIDGRPFERFVGNAEKAALRELDDLLVEIDAARKAARPVDRLGLDFARDIIRERIERLAAGRADD